MTKLTQRRYALLREDNAIVYDHAASVVDIATSFCEHALSTSHVSCCHCDLRSFCHSKRVQPNMSTNEVDAALMRFQQSLASSKWDTTTVLINVEHRLSVEPDAAPQKSVD
jgi:hypothetical protein